MNKGLILTLLLFSSCVYGYKEDSTNTSSASIDGLLWQLREGNSENWAQEISPEGTTRTTNILSAPFRWNTGLRVGFGYNTPEIKLDVSSSYTWFQTTAFSQASVNSGGIYSPNLGNFFANNTNGANFGPNYRNAHLHWKLLFNVLDLEIGRKFNPNQKFMFRPFVGIKAASIRQSIDTVWANPNPTTFHNITIPQNFTIAKENLKNNYVGFGPSIGLNTKFFLFKGASSSLNLFGNFSGALMWGNWKFKDSYQNNNGTAITVNVASINGASTMVAGLLGIEWSKNLANSLVKIRLGYEAQIWFNQNQYYSLSAGRLNNLMSLGGGVFGVSYVF